MIVVTIIIIFIISIIIPKVNEGTEAQKILITPML